MPTIHASLTIGVTGNKQAQSLRIELCASGGGEWVPLTIFDVHHFGSKRCALRAAGRKDGPPSKWKNFSSASVSANARSTRRTLK